MDKIVVAGYHGYENAGDDATLITILNNIRNIDKDAKIVVLSKNPELTKTTHDVNSVYRFNPFSVFFSLIGAKALVLGGGSLLQDSTSSRSIKYYLGLIKITKLLGKKVMLYSNGIGPIKEDGNRKLTSKVINEIDMITVRENFASEELEKLGVKKPEIHITADPAFSLKYLLLKEDDKKKELLKREDIPLDKKILGVSIRSYKNHENYIKVVASLCDYAIEKYDVNVVFIPFQKTQDLKISDDIIKIMKNKAYVIKEKCSVADIINILSICHVNICMRLHSIIFSALSSIPVLGLVYDPKVKYYLEILNQKSLGTNLDIELNKSIDEFDLVMLNYDKIKSDLKIKGIELEKSSILNEEYLKNILKN